MALLGGERRPDPGGGGPRVARAGVDADLPLVVDGRREGGAPLILLEGKRSRHGRV